MLNWIFIFLIGSAVIVASFTGKMPAVTQASLKSAESAVEIAIKLVGQMALWLGFMGILREAGMMRAIARLLKPVMVRLFPEVPPEHPAMGAMIMNFAANMLGLGNAATPFGLKAMGELNKLNPHQGVASNSMVLFLAINTSGIAVLALGAVAVRATLGSHDAAGIIIPSLLATSCSTAMAILVCKLTERLPRFAAERYVEAGASAGPIAVKEPDSASMAQAEEAAVAVAPASGPRKGVVLGVVAVMLFALGRHVWLSPPEIPRFEIARGVFSDWLLPILMIAIVAFGLGRRVKVYEVFVSSAKEGFQIAVTIIPFLIAILVAVGMFRASGAMDFLVSVLQPVTTPLGFPGEVLPMALIRPLSGSGALAVMTETMTRHHPDSFIGYLTSTVNGSMETTFYVLAVYFGAVQVKAVRHTMIPCLSADLAGIVAATAVCHLFFGGAPLSGPPLP